MRVMAAGTGSGSGSGSAPMSWLGEEYEEDAVRGLDPAYLKFSARLARQPGQCVRWVGEG